MLYKNSFSLGKALICLLEFYLFVSGCVRSPLLLGLFSTCSEWGLIFAAVLRLLNVVVSLVVKHALQSTRASAVVARELGSTSSIVVAEIHGQRIPCGGFHVEDSMDRGAWQAIGHGVTKSQTGLSDFHFHIHIYTSSLLLVLLPHAHPPPNFKK